MISRNSATRFFDRAKGFTTWLGVDDRTRAIALPIAIFIVAACAAWLTGAPVWRLYAYVPQEGLRSDRLRISHALATDWLRDPPDVLVLGGSQMREMMPADEFVSAQLSSACGRPIRVLNAASSSQLLETSWSIVDHFSEAPPAFVLLGTNPWRARTDPERTRGAELFLLPTVHTPPPEVAAMTLSVGARARVRLAIMFADVVTAFGFREQAPLPVDGPFEARQHQYRLPVWTSEYKTIDARYQKRLTDDEGTSLRNNLTGYLAFAHALALRGTRTAFVAPPASPETVAAFHGRFDEAARGYVALATAGDLLDLRDSPPLASEDFWDGIHLVGSGRHKLWPVLERYLIANALGCNVAGEAAP